MHGTESAILFGPYARQEATSCSDIDFVVIGEELLDPTDIFCIVDELYWKLGKNVSLYELCEFSEGAEFYHTTFSDEGESCEIQ